MGAVPTASQVSVLLVGWWRESVENIMGYRFTLRVRIAAAAVKKNPSHCDIIKGTTMPSALLLPGVCPVL